MYPCVVQSDDDVIGCKMKRRDNTLIRSNLPRDRLSTGPPCSFNHVPLLEVRFVGRRFRSESFVLSVVLRGDLRDKARIVDVYGRERWFSRERRACIIKIGVVLVTRIGRAQRCGAAESSVAVFLAKLLPGKVVA